METTAPPHRAWFDAAAAQVQGGRQEEAIATLRAALEGGHLLRVALLRDSRFDPLRRTREFQRIASEAAKVVRKLGLKADLICVPPANGDRRPPLVVGLHGANSSAAELAEDWRAASEAGYMLVALQSSQPVTDHSFCWDAPEQVERDLDRLSRRITRELQFDPDRVVLAGFSQGAAVAARAALVQRPLTARGFVLAAPALGRFQAPDRPARSGLRGAVVLGDEDGWGEGFAAHEEGWMAAGVSLRVERFPGLGHVYPEGFAELLPELLGWTIG